MSGRNSPDPLEERYYDLAPRYAGHVTEMRGAAQLSNETKCAVDPRVGNVAGLQPLNISASVLEWAAIGRGFRLADSPLTH